MRRYQLFLNSLFYCFLGVVLLVTSSCDSNNEVLPPLNVKIGVLLPLTGPFSPLGKEILMGMHLAYDKIQSHNSVGIQIDLITADNQSTPEGSRMAVQELIDQGVVAIMGAFASSNSLAAAPIAQKAKIPMISPMSTNIRVTQVGDYISRICFTDDFQGEVMASFASNSLNHSRIAVITDETQDYSKGLSEEFIDHFELMGGTIHHFFSSPEKIHNQTTALSLLNRIKELNVDSIFFSGYHNEAGILLRLARENLNIQIPLLGGDALDTPDLAPIAGEKGFPGNYISTHFSPYNNDSLQAQDFVDFYQKTYNDGTLPNAFIALGYDVTMVLANAIIRSVTGIPEDIKAAVNSTYNFPGVTGTITLNKDRNAVKPAVILETTPENDFIYHSEVIPPLNQTSSYGLVCTSDRMDLEDEMALWEENSLLSSKRPVFSSSFMPEDFSSVNISLHETVTVKLHEQDNVQFPISEADWPEGLNPNIRAYEPNPNRTLYGGVASFIVPTYGTYIISVNTASVWLDVVHADSADELFPISILNLVHTSKNNLSLVQSINFSQQTQCPLIKKSVEWMLPPGEYLLQFFNVGGYDLDLLGQDYKEIDIMISLKK